jgi:hypothetical protein
MLTSSSHSARNNFIASAAILLLGLVLVAVLFYLALAARLADNTVALTGVARPAAPSLVIGEGTRPTQAPIP